MAMPAFAELHCLSNHSFLEAASHPEELVERARALGYAALALTDQASLGGVVRAHRAAKAVGLHLILGAELRLIDGPRCVLLVEDRVGWANLCRLLTRGRRRAPKGRCALTRADLEDIETAGCLALWLPRGKPVDTDEGAWLAGIFADRCWLGLGLRRRGRDRAWLDYCRGLTSGLRLRLVAANGVRMHSADRKPLLDTLTAVRHRRPLAELGYLLEANAEAHLRRREVLARIYPPELLKETLRVAERCRFGLDQLRYRYPTALVPAGETPTQRLRTLTLEGMRRRWPDGAPPKVPPLLEKELALIAELGYEAYFLTVYDIVRFARGRGILCQGRGSAANSAVCYCLGITEVDPSRMEMLFERFISRERGEPPDIDVDFEHHRREEVLQYIYRRYGRDHAALTATLIRYRPRSAIRDLGPALGLPAGQVDRLSRSIAWWDGSEIPVDRLLEAGLDPNHPRLRRCLELVREVLGFPRHLSQHVGGMVISRDPLDTLVPIENAAMPQRTLIQWDKDDLDALGILKVDCLALGMLTAIRRCLDLVNAWHGWAGAQALKMADIPAEDPAVYAMIQRAETVGVFQIESRAQMSMLPRLRPASFYDLVIEVAIVRPGPIQGDMVHPYLRRRQGLEAVTYPSAEVREVLGRTLGVPIFQEQVIKMAMVAAGFSAGEADQLRRSIAAWRRRGTLERFERQLIEGMCMRGYDEEYARRLYRQILGFGEYGFPESHAAGFALIAWSSAWLKHHYPAAFFAALIDSQPMGFYAPAQLLAEARRLGVEVRPVRVTASGWACRLEAGSGPAPALRLGLELVKGLGRAAAERIETARAQRPFTSVADLAARAGLDRAVLEALAEADTLADLAGHRHAALWEVLGSEPLPPLFADAGRERDPEPPRLPLPTPGERVLRDYACLGLTLGPHPLKLLRPRLERRGLLQASGLASRADGTWVRVAGLVVTRQRPGAAKGVTFVTLEDETGQVNLVIWKALAERQRRILLGARLLGAVGELQRQSGVTHVIARRLVDYSRLLGGLQSRSRDFH